MFPKPAHAAPNAPTEYQLKAVFLFNFALFVDWPPSAFPSADTPFVIGVLGSDPFGDFLDETVRGEKVNNRPIVIQRFSDVDEIRVCHILFVSWSEEYRFASIMPALRSRGILTVSDAPSFSRHGGIIRFATVENKIRLKINVDAAREAGLTISSKLLRPAEIVSGNGP